MKSDIKISVIIPIHEPGSYVWDCLGSIARQTLDRSLYEVILILNGAKEPHHELIKKFIQTNGITNGLLLYKDVGNLSVARNRGMEKAVGEHIVFLDDDDYLSVNYLETVLRKAEESTVVLTDHVFFEDGTNRELDNPRSDSYVHDDETDNILKYRKWYRTCTFKVISRDVIGSVRFDPELDCRGEDTQFMLECLPKAKKIKTTEQGCYYYRRIRKNSVITSYKTTQQLWIDSGLLLLRHAALFGRRSYALHKIMILRSMLGISRHLIKSSILRLLSQAEGSGSDETS